MEQSRLLDLFVAATAAEPDASTFACKRLLKLGFTWIMHPGFYHDVRMAHWDDMINLDRVGLLKLHCTADELEDSSFCLTPIACKASAQCNAVSQVEGVTTITIDINVSDHT